ncbi:DsbA family protein [Henriciella marina]|uniref:DsbA family protein n=1 Tax=Henriciella marina TaxID=453851 RepID=UPI00036312BF|nr:DsbA family protein [Henriciella marina]
MRQVEYFHDVADPYSQLTAQILPEFCRRYDVELAPRLVSPPPDWAAPDREKLISYSRKDAALLAAKAGLVFEDRGAQPIDDKIEVALGALAAAIEADRFAEEAAAIGSWLWAGEGEAPSGWAKAADLVEDGNARRDKLGHYLGATFHYQGEWYWGLDRLHYLEARLQDEGADQDVRHGEFLFAPPAVLEAIPVGKFGGKAELHFYLSFRSPYTAIAAKRAKALAEAYGATLRLRFVLPMVMRGLPVPRMKGLYILKDTAREARRMDIPFGKVCDPVGTPVERGYAILPWAIKEGKGYEFTQSFLSGVWAEGLDAGTDKGLKQITERAGLRWSDAKTLIGGDHWRAEAETNRSEMMALGIWGVPSFRVGDGSIWGQDRLWVIEDALNRALDVSNAGAIAGDKPV